MFDYLSNSEYGITDVIELYKWVQSLTRTSMKDMFKTFNCIGYYNERGGY